MGDILNNKEIIVKMKFGSHLYGTDTINSDLDYKAIYIPSFRELILNQTINSEVDSTGAKKSKNTSDDIDTETFSLQYFLKLAIKGEMIVIDMLHAPDNMIEKCTDDWLYLRNNRAKFYTKDMKGYIGYIRKQLSLYGDRAKRLANYEMLKARLDNMVSNARLIDVWDDLPENEYCIKREDNIYEVCGKKFKQQVFTSYLYDNVKIWIEKYGNRVQAAYKTGFTDYKALSHAFRSCYQLKEIYSSGDLIYPLKDANYLRDMKIGNYNYETDNLDDKLEDLLFEVEELAKNSKYPDKIDEDFIVDYMTKIYKKRI